LLIANRLLLPARDFSRVPGLHTIGGISPQRRVKMKRISMVLVVLSVVAGLSMAQDVYPTPETMADKNQPQVRNLSGQVFTKSDSPISEAVVYLKNTKTLTIKTFITEKDGGYRFPGLSPAVDYEIYADYQGQKSPTKTISSFDTRSNVTLNLHVDTK
jgi:hypothetical protein